MEVMNIPDFLRNPEIVRSEGGMQKSSFRFVKRDLFFFWCNPSKMNTGDVDCTDMTREEFSKIVEEVSAKRAAKLGSGLNLQLRKDNDGLL
jgi:hypothetical protein